MNTLNYMFAASACFLMADLEAEVVAFGKKFTASGKEISRSYRDHAAGRAEIETVLNELNRDWQRSQQRALDLRFELRNLLTREEWAALFPKE